MRWVAVSRWLAFLIWGLLLGCGGSRGGRAQVVATGVFALPLSTPLDASVFRTRQPSIAGGSYHLCAIADDGTVGCWGYNRGGQLGDGTTSGSEHPVKVVGLDEVVELALGIGFSCARRANREVWCWGVPASRAVSWPGVDPAVPRQMKRLAGALQIRAGDYHLCAVMADRSVRCLGDNVYGITAEPAAKPLDPAVVHLVEGMGDVVELAAGTNHSCALRRDGSVWCWGLHVGRPLPRPWHVPLPGPTSHVAGGGALTCALTLDSQVWCWGSSGWGLLWDGARAGRSDNPVRIHGLGQVQALSVGSLHACAQAEDSDTLWCWGSNAQRQLGPQGETASGVNSPALAPWLKPAAALDLSGLEDFVAAGLFSCARVAGRLLCWGDNTHGTLANRDHQPSASPRRIPWPPGARAALKRAE